MNLKEYRISLGITIKEASNATGVALRTYNRYEHDDNYGDPLKRASILSILKEKYEVTEEKGLLTIELIKEHVTDILNKYKEKIDFCYLFGSYSKGYAKENSDVDLCVSTTLTGLNFIGLIEELRQSLRKRIDLIRLSDLKNNIELLNEIMKDGIKIYG
ncbi:MAG: nucleotidyltransferase domain-containing protein [Bacilli bacterium]|nr:nucleotidyltransferase domain-containing protein [Bacillales bacterium]MDY2575533.1 nucleotidyltransferase domain-containing protein [Bacilli bacterium]